MSDYNAKNYTEQGGEVTHIGGKIVYDNGLMPNMSTADVTSDTVAKVRTSLNALITNLKNQGWRVCHKSDLCGEALLHHREMEADGL